MDKESLIELQKIDCNCNDCKFMVRDLAKFNASIAENERIQKWSYDTRIAIIRERAEDAKRKTYDLERWDALHTEADKIEEKGFKFNRKSACIGFGHCQLLDKDVSFIAGRCQPETQHCFVHRSEPYSVLEHTIKHF